jgi:hypothetical protein
MNEGKFLAMEQWNTRDGHLEQWNGQDVYMLPKGCDRGYVRDVDLRHHDRKIV